MLNSFKKDFLFGSASAAYQVEGAYREDGKGMSVWDEWVRLNGKTFEGTNGEVAADHYHKYKEDIALMKEMGLKAYRFSIAWTRILPFGRGKIEAKGLEFYHQLIDELIEAKIEPVVTIYHWDLPQALQDEYCGWESRKIIEDFTAYSKILFEEYGDKVKYWIVLNEPNIFTQLGYLLAMHPPGKKDMKTYLMTYHHTALVHANVVKLYKEMGYKGCIGSSVAYTPGYSASEKEEDKEALRRYYETVNWWLMDIYQTGSYPKWGYELFQKQGIAPEITEEDKRILKESGRLADFIGINYYQSRVVTYVPETIENKSIVLNTDGNKGATNFEVIPGIYKGVENPYLEKTDWDWELDPIGLRTLLNDLNDRYHLPLIITENGIGVIESLSDDGQVHDDYRIDYLRNHLKQCHLAINDGVELFGYCPWSFMDLLSTTSGFRKRYGLVYVNRKDNDVMDLRRIKKDSFYWYRNVICSNGDNL